MEESPESSGKNGTGEAPVSEKRLIITEMVLENFKSYAGIQRVGPFHKCFSSVVGPNGSGKSNVIDAMLFVFGKRAKQLRLSKVSELIHNSTNHQDLQEARVTVYFQEIWDKGDEEYAVVPDSKLVVARVAYRNNSSKYLVNDRTSTFTQVTTLLKEKGIDLDNNRFLILQGEVEQIAMMKPRGQGPNDEGLLEYLEDIIGSNRYVQQIETGAEELEALNEKRVSMAHRVKGVEKEKEMVEGGAKEAEAYVQREADKLTWQSVKEQKQEEELQAVLKAKKEQLGKVAEQLQTEMEKNVKLKATCEEKKVLYDQQTEENRVTQDALEKCADEFRRFECRDVQFQEERKHCKTKIKKLEEKMNKDSKKVGESEKEMRECTAALPRLEEEVEEATAQLGEEEKKVEKMQEMANVEAEKYLGQLTVAQKALEPWEKEVQEAGATKGVAEAERKLLKDKHATAARQFREAEQALQEQQVGGKQRGEELAACSAAVEKQTKEVEEWGRGEQSCVASEGGLEQSVSSCRNRVGELQRAVQAASSQGAQMKALMEAKRSGSIPGIHGRLGDLGAIDGAYDVAISTACPALEYVVVQSADDAQAGVEMLRKNKLGIATFLILDKQQSLVGAMKEAASPPEGVPRLIDLVKPQHPDLLPAFYFALRNTVVAKDLDQGSRIAYGPDKRFRRVVTMQGALFEATGTMAGGGGAPRGGRMGSSLPGVGADKATLAKAEEELRVAVEGYEEVRARGAEAAEGRKRAEEALRRLQMKIPKLKMEAEAMAAAWSELSQRLPGLEAAAHPGEAEVRRIEELQAEVEREERAIEKSMRGSAGLRKKVADLQKQMEEVGGEGLKKAKRKVANIQQAIDGKGTEINQRQSGVKSSAKSIAKLTKAVEEAKQEQEAEKAALEKKMEEWKEIENQAFVVHDEYNGAKEELERTRATLSAIAAEYSSLQEALRQASSAEVDLGFKSTELERHLAVHERQVVQCREALKATLKEQSDLFSQVEADGLDSAQIRARLPEVPPHCSVQGAAEMVAKLEALLKDKPNMAAIADFQRKSREYGDRVNELQAVTEERDGATKKQEELRKARLDDFMGGFNIITQKLKEMYQMITLGGDAELELVDSLDPFSEGIVFSVRPPKKSWKSIGNLSGGEKTLSSLALVFALHHFKPTPLYVMDEIDAALDFKNVSIVGHYIKERTKNAQFIIISLRNNMFELADRLVGIYKTDNCTKSITIDPNAFAVAAAS